MISISFICFWISARSVLIPDFTLLQESIRNSSDNVLLSTPDSLVVSVGRNLGEDEQSNPSSSVSTPRKGGGLSFGMDVLESLKFTYKVWAFKHVYISFSFNLVV